MWAFFTLAYGEAFSSALVKLFWASASACTAGHSSRLVRVRVRGTQFAVQAAATLAAACNCALALRRGRRSAARAATTELALWLYLYIAVPLCFETFSWQPLSPTVQLDWFGLCVVHSLVGALLGLRVAGMVVGWAVLMPFYLRWDGLAGSAHPVLRGTALVLGTLAGVLVVQVAAAKVLTANSAGTDDGANQQPTPAVPRPGDGTATGTMAARLGERLAAGHSSLHQMQEHFIRALPPPPPSHPCCCWPCACPPPRGCSRWRAFESAGTARPIPRPASAHSR